MLIVIISIYMYVCVCIQMENPYQFMDKLLRLAICLIHALQIAASACVQMKRSSFLI